MSIWVTLNSAPTPEDGKEWHGFIAALDLLARAFPERSFELWLWGTAVAGEGTSVVRVLWGPEVARGWVRHESQSPLVYHPMLKRGVAAPPGNRSPRTAPPRSKQ